MRIKDIGKNLQDERKVLRNGALLLCLGALLVLFLMKVDLVWEVLSSVAGTLSPVIFGVVLAYVLNVFVHFFEDIVFRPFRNSTSKAWKTLKRPLSVTLAYVVVALVVVFITCFIIPGLIESMSLLADTVQQTAAGVLQQCHAVADPVRRGKRPDPLSRTFCPTSAGPRFWPILPVWPPTSSPPCWM